MGSGHCCHADFHESAAALPRKVQGFGQFSVQTLAPEQSQWTLKAFAFKACGFGQYALSYNSHKYEL